jgi:hypothetical protein
MSSTKSCKVLIGGVNVSIYYTDFSIKLEEIK